MRNILRIATVVMLLATTAWPLGAQVQGKIFQVQHADVNALAQVLSVFGATIIANPTLRTISVSARQDSMPAIEEAIKRFDVAPVPEKNVSLTFQMLLTGPRAAAGTKLPADMEGVVKQLKSVFGYENFQLMETAMLQVRNGERASSEGAANYPEAPGGQSAKYQLGFRLTLAAGEGGNLVRLQDLFLRVQVPSTAVRDEQGVEGWQYQSTQLRTDIDIREGQKVVVGKSSLDGSNNHLILVVTAEVVD